MQDAIESHLASQASSFEALPPREIHAQLKRFVEAEKSAGRLTLSDEEPTPLGWQIRKMLHLIGMPLLVLLASPLLILIAPFYLFQLRRLEKADPGALHRRSTTTISRPWRRRKIMMLRTRTVRWVA